MATFTERLALIIDAQEAGAVRGLKKVSSESAKAGKTADQTGKKFSKLSTGMAVGLGAAAGVAAYKLAQFSGQAIDAARDQNEVLNKSNVIFKGNAKAVENWAAGGAKAFGLSKTAALDAAGSFGNMFDQLGFTGDATQKMSQRMVTLAADFASFHNADITQVLEAQQAGFRGEYDALQRFIPTITAAVVQQEAMKETGKKNAQALTAQEKAAATYQIILDNAGQAQGDFARTADSLANKQRITNAEWENAKAKLGQGLLPAMSAATGIANELLDAFNSLDPATRNMALGVTAVGVAALVAGPRIATMGVALKEAGVSAAGMGKGLGLASVGMLGFALAAETSLAKAADDTKSFGEKAFQVFGAIAESAGMAGTAIAKEAGKSKDAKTGTENLTTASEEYQKLLGEKVTPAVEDLADATQTAYDKQKLLHGEIVDSTEANIAFRDKVADWAKSVRDATKAGEDHTHSLNLNTQKGRDNVGALIDMAKAANDHASAVYDQTGSLGKANTALKTDRQRLLDAGTAAGFNKDELVKLINKYLKVPTKAQTKIEQPGMALSRARAEALRKKMEDLTGRDWKIRVGMEMKNRLKIAAAQGVSLTISGKPIPLAEGGPVRGPGGSTGDKIPAMLSDGEYVIKASKARQLGTRFLDTLNSAKSVGGDPGAVVLRFASGGSVAATQSFVRAQRGERYLLGGAGPDVWDCSGITGAAWALLKGLAYGQGQRYMTTQSNFSALGFKRGLGAYTIGVSPQAGHMVGNIGGLSFEAARPGVPLRVGNATSVKSMAQQWFLASLGGAFGSMGTVALNNSDLRKIMKAIGIHWGVPFAGTKFDRGGWLHPGTTLAVNKTGRSERVLPPGADGGITINGGVHLHGVQDINGMVAELQRYAKRNGGIKIRTFA